MAGGRRSGTHVLIQNKLCCCDSFLRELFDTLFFTRSSWCSSKLAIRTFGLKNSCNLQSSERLFIIANRSSRTRSTVRADHQWSQKIRTESRATTDDIALLNVANDEKNTEYAVCFREHLYGGKQFANVCLSLGLLLCALAGLLTLPVVARRTGTHTACVPWLTKSLHWSEGLLSRTVYVCVRLLAHAAWPFYIAESGSQRLFTRQIAHCLARCWRTTGGPPATETRNLFCSTRMCLVTSSAR